MCLPSNFVVNFVVEIYYVIHKMNIEEIRTLPEGEVLVYIMTTMRATGEGFL